MRQSTKSEPEKIYRTVTGPSFRPSVTCQESLRVGCNTPYIRMDLYAKIEAENRRLRELLETMIPTVGTVHEEGPRL